MKETSSGTRLSVVIPAYNEGDSIVENVLQINEILNKENIIFEIIVVDDGSSDSTYANIPDALNIIRIKHDHNLGYGAALKTGIMKSCYENILITDADGTYPVESIPELINEVGGYDMIIGARTGEKVQIPLVRRPAKWVLNVLANYLVGVKIPDLNSGLRIMKRSLINEFWNLLPSGFSFTTTITLAALTNNYNVKNISINYHKRQGKSKINPIHDTLNFFTLIFHTIIYFKPLKVFFPSGIFLFILSLIKFIYDGVTYKYYFSGLTIILAMMAVQVIILGIVADLIVSQSIKK